MAALSDFHRFVLPFINGAPLPAIEDAILDAAIEYCRRTRLLRVLLDPISLVPGEAELELDPPDGDSQITDVTGAWLPGRQLDPATRPELDALFPRGWAGLTVDTVDDVARYYCRAPGTIQLVPGVSVRMQRALVLEVAYAPTRTATTVPDLLLDRYAEKLQAGALARLHQHAAPYADPSRAVTYVQLFDSYCDTHADESAHGFAHHPLRTGRDEIA